MASDWPDGEGERRLHPLSWLFVLLQQLRAFAVPLVVLLVTGRGSDSEWVSLLGVAGLTLASVAQYFTYRYRSGPDGFVIRSGVLQRTRRDIPYERIHTVHLHQTLLHRLFGVTEVRLESGGSRQAEAVMRVLSVADARALEALVRERGTARRAGAVEAGEAPPEVPLLALDTAEVVRLGLISNRGMVVVAAVAGAIWQVTGDAGFGPGGRGVPNPVPAPVRTAAGYAGRFLADHADAAAGVVLAGLLLVVLLAIVRLLSVLLALLQYHGFSLVGAGPDVRIERGLLTRVRHQMPRRRIQAWHIDETLLHRWCRRQSLRVDSMVGGAGDDRGLRHLAPIAEPETVTALLRRLMAGDVWPHEAWRPVHPRAWRRMFVLPAGVVTAAAVLLAWRVGPPALALLAAVPLVVVRARGRARFAGYAVVSSFVLVRSGWLNRQWGLVDVRKVQALRLTRSPIDRRHGTATLWIDSAGAGASGPLRVRYLPVDEARALHDRIAAALDPAPSGLEAPAPRAG